MKTSQILASAILTAAALASPFENKEARDTELLLRDGAPASACYAAADPHCCVPTYCRCADNRIYLFNTDRSKAGGNGCDPPWGYLADRTSQLQGYCCDGKKKN